ncbi:redox-sensing transcriptional repressor Rex [Levilactobacillus brevis]|uniref:Redox-sensing transcriptional repressor Rex n=1 Tax=Levilactobacillus brevis ATCC 14869 = DSM 20054 TaxID=649758 RepID=U2NT63_LEVBR|nr:redox-sensing transcriptional repressor Rex [Levilactobacillus brevis]ERK41220.1 CoA binding domain protein [Levilactobacillus brevis ATCC 14869 = DSM 20054]KIO98172.1 Redox-sensitive transcriptional regulator (AT-rich DNA-binding protein) [Levilactobacillus brevis]KRK19853.1 redox-sensing transcriptional repressor Rex [Levilactobacillus brevis ATCC 14869 = DSM 20054]MCT3572684.1 redox-sensing transcriptional repressor Rex [Levilactobacillus brevis]SQG75574.1 Redox-sensing transcriptional r
MTEQKIPRATAKRLPIYYRYLNILLDADKTRVSSTELSEAVKVDSATIRRDFSYFCALGKRGYGYDVESLIKFFKKILNQDRLTNVALIGVGNLGHALLNFNFHQDGNVRISAAFDVNETIANTIQSGVPIYPMTDLRTQLEEQQIQVAILTVPSDVAQSVTDDAVAGGVKGILNFTPLRITVPKDVRVQNVDLTNELQTLIYFLEHYNSKE